MSVIKKYEIQKNKNKGDYTFSGFKRGDVLKNFEKCLNDRNYEKACIWAIELDISSSQELLWNKIQTFSIKEVNIICPHFFIYLSNRINEYNYNKNKVVKGELHNNQHNRNNLIETVCILSLIGRNREKKLIKINKNDLIINNIKSKFMYNDFKLLENIIKITDDKNIIKPCNELANILRINDHKHESEQLFIYWISWLYEYNEKVFKINKKYCCSERNIDNILEELKKDVLFVIWEIFFYECKYRNNKTESNLIQSLFNLFKNNYKKSSRKSKLGYK